MTKKTLRRWLWKNSLLSLLVAVLLLPFACRTEKDLSENEQQSEYFQVFSKQSIYSKNENQLDYAKGFAFLAQRYDSLHNTNISGLVNTNNQTNWNEKLQQKFIEKSNDTYVEFRIHSQTIEDDNGDKWVVYPRIQNQQVKELVLAVLSENETLVYFYNIDTNTSFHKTNAPLFQERYNEHFLTDDKSKIQLVFQNSKCGREGYDPCEIQGVIITQESSGSGNAWGLLNGGSGEGDGGDCNGFDACIETDDSGGGGSSTLPYVYIDSTSCQKAKSLITNEDIKSKIDSLKAQSALETGSEKGFAIKSDNTPTNLIDGGKHHVNFKNYLVDYIGIYHNHTSTGIKIFSPPDIILLFTKMLSLPDGVEKDNAFIGVIAGEETTEESFNTFHYVIRYTGNTQNVGSTYTALNSLTTDKINELMDDYYKLESKLSLKSEYTSNNGATLNAKGLEKLFFGTLKNMGVDQTSITLQKINTNTNKITNINADQNGIQVATPCL